MGQGESILVPGMPLYAINAANLSTKVVSFTGAEQYLRRSFTTSAETAGQVTSAATPGVAALWT